ncbi:CaiB/BaiF CoA transferase family protein [Paraburkholderia aspalathi]|uniref:Formyl-CoA transferase/CoA:oxalate CoA-transferase n=1 Tax=Paraburkholderia aspalathi TaxID=1324617 RepID=A0A1I7DBX4_9BURK|nr:CoA transferase [Paraburkholderia aspalathi]SFU09233.1 formyl-CoA transferase/CoA:oxalate CoA-transferase [Paraburkholderia aspalathi]
MRRPLEGIKVLDLTHGVAGPYCTMVLGDLGADIVKIEKPERGDATRYMNVSEKFHSDIPRVGGDYFLAVNRNKRSVAIEMKSEDGRKLCEELAAWADVVVQNFRPGVTQRLGLDYESLKRFNPKLIYANISAYGASGELSEKAGMDIAVQARSGVMRITGAVNSDEPLRPGASIADFGGGIYLVAGLLAALFDRERTGRGQEVSVSLLDATMSLLINYSVAVMDGGANVRPLGSGHPQLVPYQAFPTSDGFVVVATGTNKTYRTMCDAIGCSSLAVDERFASNQSRVLNRAEMVDALSAVFRQQTCARWIEILEAADVPCAPVNELSDAFEELKTTSPDMVKTVEHAALGKLSQLGVPFRFSDCGGDIRKPPPMLGEHTDEVLAQLLGRSPDAIASLRERKVI